MRFLASLLLGLLMLTTFCRAADFYPITAADKKFLAEVLVAVHKKDAAWIADHMNYPVSVVTDKGRRVVKTKKEFTTIVTRQLTDKVCDQIAADATKPLFKNWSGVMVGDGILWFSEYGTVGSTSHGYVIFAIGLFAFQLDDRPNTALEPTPTAP